MTTPVRGRKATTPRVTPAAPKSRPRSEVVLPGTNVHDAALDRIRWLFEEFDGDVAVSNSGGKDSTVVLELAAIVAAERGELPLRVTFLDQECELQGTVDYQRYLMYERDDIDFHWYQVPFRLENSTNTQNAWLNVWDPDLELLKTAAEGGPGWVREKEPGTIHSVTDATRPFAKPITHTHFYNLLSEINFQTAACVLSGMRAEESPNRRMTLVSKAVYKWVTWGSFAMGPRGAKAGRYRFHPIYDWSYRDVWKAMHEHSWKYNEIYDHQYRYGVPIRNMRVSNYHHETALSTLSWLQEVEPATWEAATRRLQGISTRGHLHHDQMPETLPYMFGSWDEYGCYLIDHLIRDPDAQQKFYGHRDRLNRYCPEQSDEARGRQLVTAIIGNDQWGTTIDNWINGHKITGQKALPRTVPLAANPNHTPLPLAPNPTPKESA